MVERFASLREWAWARASGRAALEDRIAAELLRPVASPVQALAAWLTERLPGASAVLFYGSCRRAPEPAAALHDFYVLLDRYSDAPGSVLLRLGGWLLAASLGVHVADAGDREAIYRLRHRVYASELHQHSENAAGRLVDGLDSVNVYLVVKSGDAIVGHISVTPPGDHRYSLEKYLSLEDLPFSVDARTYEVRLLTVREGHRSGPAALLLLLAALRWIQARGGTRIIALGRREVLPFYVKAGLMPVGVRVKSGAVDYELMTATTHELARVAFRRSVFRRAARGASWHLDRPSDGQGSAQPTALP